MNGDSKTFCQSNKKKNSDGDEWWFDVAKMTVAKDFSCADEADKCFFAIGGGAATKEACDAAWKAQDAVPLTLFASFPDEDPVFTAVRFFFVASVGLLS